MSFFLCLGVVILIFVIAEPSAKAGKSNDFCWMSAVADRMSSRFCGLPHVAPHRCVDSQCQHDSVRTAMFDHD
jgi:hypothetical protein